MKLKKDSEYVASCEICEHSFMVETTGQYLCRFKNKLKETAPENSCADFSLDLLSIEPHARQNKKYEFANI